MRLSLRGRLIWCGVVVVVLFAAVALFPVLLPNLGRNQGLQLGQERSPAGEAQAIEHIVGVIEKIIRRMYPHSPPTARRDAHAKAFGCVRGTFAVEKELPPELAVGLFKTPQSFPAWIRFSSSNRTPQPDLVKDGRGMAIKLLGIPGDKLLPDELKETTHDFVMINHPVFFVRNALDYVDFTDGEERDARTSFFFGLRLPTSWRLHEMFTGYAITHHPIRSPLEQRYFSMSPYRLGERAIKFSAVPCAARDTPVPPTGDDALHDLLVQQLATDGSCFEFQVQLQKDPHDMPIEDPSIEWSEKDSPFRTVARLTIPAQKFDSEAQTAFCENLSFTPWHALPEHRPLGGINRVRREAYRAISRLRHELNAADRKEPTGSETF